MTSPRHMRLALTSSLAVIGLLTAGCANQVTAYRTQRIGPNGPMVITTDAYQRHLVMTPDNGPGREGMWRTCAEASPDVFSAISGSGAGDLGFNSTGGTGTEAQARAAMGIAQTAATAERTQTINLLRESMFRTCERYLSGAIDPATFVVQAGRDWRAMIAILAIEQLTATGRPASTIISAGATSATVMGGDEARRQLDEAEADLTAARQRLQAAEARTCDAADENAADDDADEDDADSDDAADDGAADDDAADDDASDDDASDDDAAEGASPQTNSTGGGSTQTPATAGAEPGGNCATEKQTEITAATTAVSEAEDERETAQRRVDQIARSSASTSPGTVNAVGSSRSLTPAALSIVAPIVERIVMEAFETDETQLFCLQLLRDGSTRLQPVLDRCLVYLMERVDQDTVGLLNQRVLSQQIRIRDQTGLAQIRLAQHFAALSTDEYERERAALTTRIGRFCENLSQEQCVVRILGGRVVAGFQDEVLSYLREREQSQERRR